MLRILLVFIRGWIRIKKRKKTSKRKNTDRTHKNKKTLQCNSFKKWIYLWNLQAYIKGINYNTYDTYYHHNYSSNTTHKSSLVCVNISLMDQLKNLSHFTARARLKSIKIVVWISIAIHMPLNEND